LLSVSIRGIILQSNPNVKQLGYKIAKKVKEMRKYMKISGLAVICSIAVAGLSIAGLPDAMASDKTLVDYLNDKNVSFLIVNTGENARLTTFGWQEAKVSCKTIRTAGFNVSNIRNYDAETRAETIAVCKN